MRPGHDKALKDRAPGSENASPAQAHRALIALAAAAMPFFFSLPPWVAGGALVIMGWRTLLLRTRRPLPGIIVKTILIFLALVAVVISFRSFGGATAGGAFLVITAALKSLESRSVRDFRIVALSCWLLLGAAFLLDQSLVLGIYAVFVAWLSVLALQGVHETLGWPARARITGRVLVAALPVALILFVMFPRLPGPLFRFGAPKLASVSGLSDILSPGSIAALSQSNAIAFRVKFQAAVPKPAARYFRGPVFTHFNGTTWLTNRDIHPHLAGQFKPSGTAVHYRVLERANGTRYLFALALPIRISTASRLTPDYELLAPHRLWNDIEYNGVSFPHYAAQVRLPPATRAANLELPSGADPRTRALARKWRGASKTPAGVVRKALAWFRDKPFYYTLRPGRLSGRNQIDTFLFRTRRGFCEHYASAFAVLMRAAGIPTRVVTGYAGGAINPYDGWLVLRQSNAHAWDEVWLAHRGWVRVDPTSVIPPGRIEASAASAVASSPVSHFRHLDTGFFWHIRNFWDAVNTTWTEYVIGYGHSLQNRLFDKLGLAGAGPLAAALLMVALAAMAGMLVALFGFTQWRTREKEPVKRIYSRWCRRLARSGLERRPWEGPVDFSRRVARAWPERARAADEIARLYCAARYGEDATATEALKRRVRQWRQAGPGPAATATRRRGRSGRGSR
ncbi:MAG TPA: DUF3488 and transglutaminase-like domain-containing protein [Gammaproteobacteria bacterium]|nr:DUF3488 and transglutaminase-like domain-containing protein [Gammaproteobacteria bacterium]